MHSFGTIDKNMISGTGHKLVFMGKRPARPIAKLVKKGKTGLLLLFCRGGRGFFCKVNFWGPGGALFSFGGAASLG